MERWLGRVAIVTGASAGIGEAIARLLVQNGMRVVAVARREERLKALAEDLKGAKGQLYAIQGDVTKEEDVVRAVKFTRDTLGGPDVLVNNAGIYYSNPLSDANTDKLRKMLDVNVFGLCIFTREVIKDMRDRGVDDGHIFHISSIAGQRILDYVGSYAYAASKHAVAVMTEGLRRELRDLKTKIRVTGISPGMVRTEIIIASGGTPEAAKERYSTYPCLEPEDVANALLYALGTPPHVQALGQELREANGELHAFQCDVSKEEDVIAAVKFARDTLGGADVLVNNAGVYQSVPLPEVDTNKIRKMLDVNILGLCMFTREVIKNMRDRGVDDGHIFHIGSIGGQCIVEGYGSYVYSATKHAVRVMTEGLRRELRKLKTNIRVTEVSPGTVRTKVLVVGDAASEAAVHRYAKNPYLEPEDVAQSLLYALATPSHVQIHEIIILPTGAE